MADNQIVTLSYPGNCNSDCDSHFSLFHLADF
jgi:hypothetical protein